MELKLFEEKDYKELKEFMTPLWHDTYKEILPPDHIDFLISKYFAPESIERFKRLGYEYYTVNDKKRVGVVVICESDGSTYLDKLYLDLDARGKGYASFVFSELLKLGRDITLNVNQGNERAIRCYKKNGFVLEREQMIPLENGKVNCDYIMRLKHK